MKLEQILKKDGLLDNHPLYSPKPSIRPLNQLKKSPQAIRDFISKPKYQKNSQTIMTKTRPAEEKEKKAKVSSKETKTPEKEQSKKEKSKAQASSKKQKPQPQTQPPKKKRFKILPGNGCHQAICEVQAMLIPPTNGKFYLILPDGLQLEAFFQTPKLYWVATNRTDSVTGLHWFRCYPKMKDARIVALQIIGWDGNMLDNRDERWEFTGVWLPQKNLTVQRTMSDKQIRKIAKETGFIKKFKYIFINSRDFARNLWAMYVYKVLAVRQGDQLKIRKVIPIACPRIKPMPPERKPRKKK